MGDRACIKIKYESGQEIYFYTHWGGSELPYMLGNALKRGRGRWSDESYLSRIIFCEMIQDNVMGETGFGIAPWEPGDVNHPTLVVNMNLQYVMGRNGTIYSFEDYVSHFSP